MSKTVKFAAFLFVIFLGSMVFAQGIDDVYQVNYYTGRTTNYDSTVRIINTGQQGTPISSGHGTVCADIYVFDNTQEMLECCSCPITANGLLELSLKYDLMQNPLTGLQGVTDKGVVKIVSDNRANCNPFSPVPVPDLRSWSTHIQRIGNSYDNFNNNNNNNQYSNYVTTEEEFSKAPLQSDELSFLGQACSFVQYLGTGKGVCSCGNGPA